MTFCRSRLRRNRKLHNSSQIQLVNYYGHEAPIHRSRGLCNQDHLHYHVIYDALERRALWWTYLITEQESRSRDCSRFLRSLSSPQLVRETTFGSLRWQTMLLTRKWQPIKVKQNHMSTLKHRVENRFLCCNKTLHLQTCFDVFCWKYHFKGGHAKSLRKWGSFVTRLFQLQAQPTFQFKLQFKTTKECSFLRHLKVARPSLKHSRGTNYNTLRQLVISSVDFNMQDTKNERKTSGV